MELDVYKSKGEGGNRTLFGDVLSDQFHSQTWYHSLGSLWPFSVLWFWMRAHSQAEHPAAVPAGGR